MHMAIYVRLHFHGLRAGWHLARPLPCVNMECVLMAGEVAFERKLDVAYLTLER